MFIVLFFSPDFRVFEIGEKYTPISAFSKPHPSLNVMFRGGATAGRSVVWCGVSVPQAAGGHWGGSCGRQQALRGSAGQFSAPGRAQ